MRTLDTRRALKHSWLSAILMLLMIGNVSAQEVGDVVNTNGSFEDADVGDTSGITNWNLEGADYADYEIVADPDNGDNKLLRAELTNVAGADNPWNIQPLHTGYTLVEGNTYKAVLRIKADNQGGGTPTIGFDAGNGVGIYGRDISAEGDSWQEIESNEFTFAADGSQQAGIHLGEGANADGDVFYIDYIQLVLIAEAAADDGDDDADQTIVNANGDFSDADVGDDSGITNWTLEGADFADYEIVADPDNGDNKLLRAELTNVAGADNPWNIQPLHTGYTLVEGNTYKAVLRIKADNQGGGTPTIGFDAGNGVGIYGRDISAEGDSWQEIESNEFTFAADGSQQAGIHLGEGANADGDIFYIDYINIVLVSEASDDNGEDEPEGTLVNANGDFSGADVGDTSDVTNWTLEGADFADYEIVADPDNGDNKLLRAEITDIDGADNPWNIQPLHTGYTLVEGNNYKAVLRIKADNQGGGTPTIGFDAGNGVGIYGRDISDADGDWIVIESNTFTFAADGSQQAGIHLGAEANANGDIFYIDNVQILDLGPAEVDDDDDVTPPSTGNLANNGSFEDGDLGEIEDFTSIDGWVFELGGEAEATFALVDDPVQDGSQALRVSVSDAGAQAWHVQAINEGIEVVPGRDYVYSVWARASAEGATASFTVGNSDFAEYGALRDGVSLPVDEWQEFTFEFTVTDDETVIRAPLHFGNTGNVDVDVFIDNLQITEVVEEPEPGSNLTTNGSFESSDLGVIDGDELTTGVEGWVLELLDSAEAEFEIVDSPIQDGDRALKVLASEVGTQAWHVQAVGDSIPVVPGTTYTFSVFARAETAGVQAAFTVGNYAFNEYNALRDGVTLPVDEWQEYTFNFTVTDSEEYIRAPIHFGFASNVDIPIYIDNLTIKEFIEDDSVPEPDGPPLAEGHTKWLGNIWAPTQLDGFEAYWNQVTPENASKWGSVEGTRGTYSWGNLDAAYDLAKDNDMPFRFHVLIWGGQQPAWLNDMSESEQLEAITEWFEAVAERYPDIDYLEVVNEPLHQRPDGDTGEADYWDALGAQGETGWDWVIKSFEMARDIFPAETKLMINDYGIIGNMQNAQTYREIIELLQERDLIDGIGLQGHAFSTRGTAQGMIDVLDYLAETGLPLQITEMDFDGNPNQSPNISEQESDDNQLETVERVFPAVWEHPAVEGVTLWGWRPGLWRQGQEAYLVRENGEERPALVWIRNYLDELDTSTEIVDGDIPTRFNLVGNYPNPFNPTTQIRYEIAENSDVTLTVYDIMGRRVQTLVNEMNTPGQYTVTFNASHLASGVYLYRLTAGSHSQTMRMMLIK